MLHLVDAEAHAEETVQDGGHADGCTGDSGVEDELVSRLLEVGRLRGVLVVLLADLGDVLVDTREGSHLARCGSQGTDEELRGAGDHRWRDEDEVLLLGQGRQAMSRVAD